MRMSVVLTDVTAAAPNPWAMRAARSAGSVPARAQAAEAAVKSASPAT